MKRAKPDLNSFAVNEPVIDLTKYIKRGHGDAFGLEPPTYKSLIPDAAGCHADRIAFCAHSAGTHTECAEHVIMGTDTMQDILGSLPPLMLCLVVRVVPEPLGDSGGDTYEGSVPAAEPQELVISRRGLASAFEHIGKEIYKDVTSVIVLTDVKDEWVFFTDQAIEFLVSLNVTNLMVDHVSIDREYCGPKMPAHRAFMKQKRATVTENLRYDPDIPVGLYLLNLQLSPFVGTDAVPSRVLLFKHAS